jgi:hypothetical protein
MPGVQIIWQNLVKPPYSAMPSAMNIEEIKNDRGHDWDAIDSLRLQ